MKHQLRLAIIFLIIFMVITGFVYPIAVTGISQLFFHNKANGSVIQSDGSSMGSELIGQPFSDPKYFWGRLSATPQVPYNPTDSSGSNYGPSNPTLTVEIQKRIDALKAVDPTNDQPIPVDLVTFSASGLDPDISIAAALYQSQRVAKYRDLSEETIIALINQYTEGRQFGIFGEPRVNVLKLNIALDKL